MALLGAAIQRGVVASRPASGDAAKAGQLYFATDEGILYHDNGTAWLEVAIFDADLETIAGLSPSNDDLLQRKAGAWINRTPAQVKTDLALVKGDVGLGNVDNTSDATKNASAVTLTNKTLTADAHDSYSQYDEIATPSNPAANKLRVYAKDVAGVTKLHTLDSSGTETELGTGGGGGGDLDDLGDVNAPSPSDGDVLTWDSTPGEWVAAAPTGGGGGSFRGARVYSNATQSINHATWTSLTFNQERRDDATFHDNSTNNSRLTTQSTGWHMIWGNVRIDALNIGKGCRIWLNGATEIGLVYFGGDGANVTILPPVTALYYLTAGDYVELQVFHSNGTAFSTSLEANAAPEFAIMEMF